MRYCRKARACANKDLTAAPYLEAEWDSVEEQDNGTDDIWWIIEGQDYPLLWRESGQTN